MLVDAAAWVHGYTVADHLGAFPGGTGMSPSPAPACLGDIDGDDLAAGISVSAGVYAPVLFDPEERVGDIAWDGITLGPDLRGSGLRSFVVRWEAAGTGRSTVAVILGG